MVFLRGTTFLRSATAGTPTMRIPEAKAFVNSTVVLSWLDRKGHKQCETVKIFGVDFVPLYGPCLRTPGGEIPLERVIACEPLIERLAS